ncbi:MAG TPA: PH domain-containing protein [Xanthobacteraceae bacterium]|jgi:uncharacterized membrane protein YdbT with pleckstrin-like domain|nr:PH domain-containing protein [Xanthobacteraceae bacterium]
MRYVEHVIQPGETLRHFTTISWVTYVPGALLLFAALALFIMFPRSSEWHVLAVVFAILAALAGVSLNVRAWFRRWTTEVAVTNHRIIYKTGFIGRSTFEIALDKVESVDVDQSILGRLFDYGEITIQGVGEGYKRLPEIDRPLEFRNHVTAA